MSTVPIPHSTLYLWQSSHSVSLSSSHSFMPRHCASSRARCTARILAILSIVWCCGVTLRPCWLTVHSIRLLESPSVLTGSKISCLSRFQFMVLSHLSLSATKNTHVVFPDLWRATRLASPAFAMSISLSIGGYSIMPPIRLLPSWVIIVAGLLYVQLCHTHSASLNCPGGLAVLFCGQFNATNRIQLSVCRSLSQFVSCFAVSVLWPPASLFGHPLNSVDFRAHCRLLTHPLSSDGPGMLGVWFEGQFDVKRRSPVSVIRLMSLLLTYCAIYVCQDSYRI